MLKLLRGVVGYAALASAGLGCERRDPEDLERWQVAVRSPGAALLSVGGTSAVDVWMVGAGSDDGPLVLHWDGIEFRREQTAGIAADLWWVHAWSPELVFMAGSGGTVLEWRAGALRRLDTPDLGVDDVDAVVAFGVWAASETDLYAVGSVAGNAGFIWHDGGDGWVDVPLPGDVPRDTDGTAPGLFKVWGRSPDDVWVVGDRGLVLRGNARAGFVRVESGVSERLFTVHGSGDRVAMVGGSSSALALEAPGEGASSLSTVTPPGAGMLQGVRFSEAGDLWAVGLGGGVFNRPAGALEWEEAFVEPVQSLHAVWVDPLGGVWAVGGNVLVSELDAGLALFHGIATVRTLELPP